jgi:hypothetical protein
MDFVGDEDATRYALEKAFAQHMEDTYAARVPYRSLPSAGIARVFLEELTARGWTISKADAPK